LIVLGLQGATSLLIVPVALTALDPGDYGVWIVIRNVGFYLALATEIGLGQTIVNFIGVAYARDDEPGINAVLTNSFCVYLILAAATTGMLIAATLVLPVDQILLGAAAGAHPSFTGLLLLYGILVAAGAPLTVFTAGLIGLRDIIVRYALEAAAIAVGFAAMLLPLVAGFGLKGFVFGSAAAVLLLPGASAIVVKARHPFVALRMSAVDRRMILRLFSNSTFFLILGAGLITQRTVGNLVLASSGALADVALMYVLTLVYRISGMSLLELVSRVAQPYFTLLSATGRHSTVVEYLSLATKLTVAAAITLAGLSTVVGTELLARIIGLTANWWVLFAMAAVMILDSISVGATNVLVALNRHSTLAFGHLLYAVLSAVLAVVGSRILRADPVLGIAIGLLVSALIFQTTVMPHIVARGLGLSATEYFQRDVAGSLAIGLSVMGVLGLVHARVPELDWFVGLGGPLFATIATYNLLNSPERKLLWSFRPRRPRE
jgi:hypothetical protein